MALLREEFRIPKLTFHSELRRRAASRLALPCTSSFIFYTVLDCFGVINDDNDADDADADNDYDGGDIVDKHGQPPRGRADTSAC